MNSYLKSYLENIKKPWGILFYRVVWEQMPKTDNAKVLDFGSGFGITANYLAKGNEVLAIEPNAEMAEMRVRENSYHQIIGGLEQLKVLPDNSFDVIVCHNVLEYAKEREIIFNEFCRIAKPNGIISIVKHNFAGRIMQKVVFENNIEEAVSLLGGREISVLNFGKVNYYNTKDIMNWVHGYDVNIEKVLGLRTFWALQQDNQIKSKPEWQDKMFKIEMKTCNIAEFVNISFFNHVLLRKHS